MKPYEITVGCHLSERMERTLPGVRIENQPTGHALLITPPIDQAGLHGLLARVRDLNVELVSVSRRQERSKG